MVLPINRLVGDQRLVIKDMITGTDNWKERDFETRRFTFTYIGHSIFSFLLYFSFLYSYTLILTPYAIL
jgi:hypothetical protein